MAYLDLITTGAKLGWGVDEDLDTNKSWHLTLTCRIAPQKSLRLKTGEKPEELRITVGFVCNDESRLHYEKQANDKLAEFAKDDGREPQSVDYIKAVGVGAYYAARDDMFHPDPPSIHFNIYLPVEEHTCVIDHAKNGQYPASIFIGMLGPQYGWEPDNSGVDWDNIIWKKAIITSFAFEIPLHVKGDEPEPILFREDHLKPVPTKTGTGIGTDLLQVLSKQVKWQTYTFWALITLVIVNWFTGG